MGKLTAVAVKAALANPGTYQDGEGLFLKVDKRGGAYWSLRVQQDGKRRDNGIGSAKLLTLAGARHKAAELRRAIKVDQRDVLAEKKDNAAAKVTAEHMKRNKAHIVPLSDEALAVPAKADALRMSESDVVFPGVAGKPMSPSAYRRSQRVDRSAQGTA